MNLEIGIVIGLLLSILWCIVEINLILRRGGIIENLEKISRNEKGSIIFPKSEKVRSIEETMKENDSRGVETNLEDISI